MSAEAPRNAGLPNFAARIKQAVVGGIDIARKAEDERILQKRQWVERSALEERAKEEQERQFVESRLLQFKEVKQIVEDLRIQDRLGYIRTDVWEGQGKLTSISTTPECLSSKRYDWKGDDWDSYFGFSLQFSYPSAVEERMLVSKGREQGYNWRLIQGTETTSLTVAVQSYDGYGAREGLFGHQVIDKEGKILGICSPYAESNSEAYQRRSRYTPFRYLSDEPHSGIIHHYPRYTRDQQEQWDENYVARLRLDQFDNESIAEKLDQILVHESMVRVSEGIIPSKLVLMGQDKLRQAKAGPHWMKWEYVITKYDDGP